MMRTLLFITLDRRDWVNIVGRDGTGDVRYGRCLVHGYGEFSAIVNCEFQNSACEVELPGTEEALLEKFKGVNKKQFEEAKIDEEKAEDEKKQNEC